MASELRFDNDETARIESENGRLAVTIETSECSTYWQTAHLTIVQAEALADALYRMIKEIQEADAE